MKTTVVFISSVQGTRWVVCCVSQIWVRVLMCFWFCSTPRIVYFIVSTRSISRCWRMLASLFFDCRTRQTWSWSSWLSRIWNWEQWAEASTGGQEEEESTGGEDAQCDLEDELHYCGCCLCSIWMFIGDVGCKEVILMLKVVLLLYLCGWRMKNLSQMTNLNVWMRNGWNVNWVTNFNVSHITKFINSSVLTFHCSTRQRRRGLTQTE
jgi:hypothetical protein